MAGKQGGLGDNFFIDGVNVSNDVGALSSISTPRTIGVNTGIDVYAFERILLRRDGMMSAAVHWNPTGAHTTLDDLPTADRVLSYFRGTAIGEAAASMIAKQINYDGTRGDDGMFTFTFEAQANGYGLEWGNQLTVGIRTDIAPTNGAALDNGAVGSPTLFGLQAYLHVFSVVGTSITVKLQDSPDNAVWTDVVGGGFAAVLAGAKGGQRIATATNLSVARYLRAVSTGTFNPATFAVQVSRNTTTPTF